MSSHREAPGISQDPVADSTDLYAFVSPERSGTVTLIANYVPLESPAGGPNFYSFGDDVLYEINIDNTGSGTPDITYQFQFETEIANPGYFLYNTGQITSLDSPNWNLKQFYTVTRVDGSGSTVLGRALRCPPCNIGPRSIPDYHPLADAAVHSLPHGERVFAGQRAEGFYVDLGAIFDLGDLRPFQNLQLIPTPAAPGVNTTAPVNVHSIAIQVPISQLTANGSVPTSVTDPNAVIGVWTTASRQAATVLGRNHAETASAGPWSQVSRLGNPLVNEVIIGIGDKDFWNTQSPANDSQFESYYSSPVLGALLPVLYPNVFPNLAGISGPRSDLVAILLSGIPSGIIPGFQNYTGGILADELRLNVAVPPSSSPNILGILGGDLAGFPNGRRVYDDVVTIEIQAVAGATLGLVDPSFTPDGAASLVNQGLTSSGTDITAMGTENYLTSFPYLGVPHSGYYTPSS
jgi:Domain of unknown function (DUF4331)